MPTENPRINVVLEKPLYRSLSKIAKRDGLSLSLKARDLIVQALELQEDIYWEKKATRRAKDFNPRKALTHQQVWK
jgi:hypothetical protein